MQAQYMIDKILAQNLIDFFGNDWIKNYSYNSYTPVQAAKAIYSHLDSFLKSGFETSWCLGGISNNCWGNSFSVSAEIEPDLPMLDEFFIEYYPSIGFMQYKIVTKSIQHDTFSDSDYYGGSTQHAKKSLNFSDLSQAMIKAKIINNPQLVRISDMESYIKEKFGATQMESVFTAKPKKTNKVKKML